MAARFWPVAAPKAVTSCRLKLLSGGLVLTEPKIPLTVQVLRKRAEFLAVAASGKKWVAPGFILQIGPAHPSTDSIHYGLTASRKVGNAVARNRARRRLRALAVELLPNASPEHDYVFIARPTTATHEFAALRADIIKGMKRMKVWRDSN